MDEPEIFDQMRDFEGEHPNLVEATKLVGATMTQYQASLAALYTPRVMTSETTRLLDAFLE